MLQNSSGFFLYIFTLVALLSDSVEGKSTSLTCSNCGGWPLRLGRNICVSLGELEPGLLRCGDYYLCVRPTEPGAELVLKYFCKGVDTASGIDGLKRSCLKEYVIKESEFGRVFSMMEGRINPSQELVSAALLSDSVTDEQMTSILQHMLVSVEKGIKRMRWELQASTLEWANKVPTAVLTDAEECIKDNEKNIAGSASCVTMPNSCCCNLLCVNVKDSSVQTTPIEERKELLKSNSDNLSTNGTKAQLTDENSKQKLVLTSKSVLVTNNSDFITSNRNSSQIISGGSAEDVEKLKSCDGKYFLIYLN
ncbi:hypothetical protein CHUAL_007298 [Chamberlinius hualienensis]